MAGLETMDVGNGDLAPQWGVDIVIHGGQVNYGPWADRQRSVNIFLLFGGFLNGENVGVRCKRPFFQTLSKRDILRRSDGPGKLVSMWLSKYL
jgi:BLTP1 N-terminal region